MVRHEDGAQGSRNQGSQSLPIFPLSRCWLRFLVLQSPTSCYIISSSSCSTGATGWSSQLLLDPRKMSAAWFGGPCNAILTHLPDCQLVPLSDPPEEKAHLVSVDGYRFADRPSSSRHLSAPDDDDANQHSPVDSSRRSSLEEPTIITAVTNSILPAHESTSTHPHSFSVASNPHSSIAAPAQAALIPRPISRNSSHPDIEQSYDDRIQRIPDRVPVLTDSYRYDRREGLMRPYRSHRCRHCAAVILNYDHHCPYIGHCVGARNRKYCATASLLSSRFVD